MRAEPHMLLVFKRQSQTMLETVVSSMSGPMVHVDMIPMGQGHAEDGVSYYTSFMFEPFSENALSSCAYTDETHAALLINMDDGQLRRARHFLQQCVKRRVQYNYPDLLPCMLASSSQSTLVQDIPASGVAGTKADDHDGGGQGTDETGVPSSMFCSQAAVLCLRRAFGAPPPPPSCNEEGGDDDEGGAKGKDLVSALFALNSRLTTPSALFNAVSPFARPIPIGRVDRAQLAGHPILP